MILTPSETQRCHVAQDSIASDRELEILPRQFYSRSGKVLKTDQYSLLSTFTNINSLEHVSKTQ